MRRARLCSLAFLAIVCWGCDSEATDGGACSGGAMCAADEICVAGTGECETALVHIPAGLFVMGCDPALDSSCDATEQPQHEVDVPAFWIQRTEVTSAAYAAFLSSQGGDCGDVDCGGADALFHVEEGTGTHPAAGVTWYGARTYCEWAGMRLCSEAEWEKAARGADGRIWPSGDEPPTCETAVMSYPTDSDIGCGENTIWPVGSKPSGASIYGVLDLAGNVLEWVEDDCHDSYDFGEGHPDDGTAWVDDPRGTSRVMKGGSLYNGATNLRASSRRCDCPPEGSMPGGGTGFRCCLSAE